MAPPPAIIREPGPQPVVDEKDARDGCDLDLRDSAGVGLLLAAALANLL